MIRDLRAGDQVLSMSWDGTTFYDEIFAFGHKEETSPTDYYEITVPAGGGGNHSLFVTKGHYIPISPTGDSSASSAVMKFSEDVKVGDFMWVVADELTMGSTGECEQAWRSRHLTPYSLHVNLYCL